MNFEQPQAAPPRSKHALPQKVGTGTVRAVDTPWSVDNEATREWPVRYQGRLIDVEAMLNAPEIEIVWRIQQFVRDGFHTLVSGPAGVHKTWFLQALHHHVLTGADIGGMECQPGPSMHFDAEVGAYGFKSRYHSSGYGRGVILLDARGLDLSRQDDQDWMAETIAAHVERDQGGLVTYDSLRALTPGAKENDSDDMTPVVRGITNISRDTGAGICGIHHSGWATNRMRGSSGIFDHCDASFSWVPATADGREAENEDEAGYERWLVCKPGLAGQKFNIGRAPKTRRFVFDEATCRIDGVAEKPDDPNDPAI